MVGNLPFLLFVLSSVLVCCGAVETEGVCGGGGVSGQKHSIPKEREKAGTYFNVESANGNLSACVNACCESQKCHVAYINGVNKKCYSIQCHSYELCEPEESTSEKHLNSTFVWVRETELKGTQDPEFADYEEPCGEEDDEKLCRPGLFCLFNQDQKERKCYCNEGEQLVREGNCKETAPKGTLKSPASDPRECERGMHECGGNEVCETETHSRTGKCRCMKGLERDEKGICVHDTTSIAPGAVSTPASVPSVAAGGGETKKGSSGVTDAKEKVTVVITGLKEVQLPADKAELHAKVQDDVSDEFSYSWKTDDSETGQSDSEKSMFVADGWDKPDMKLTRLHAGVIKFRVKVSGKNHEGSAEYSLTVLPEKKVYDPPVADIDPPSVTVQEGVKIVLDAKKSEDMEGKGLEYTWSQKNGPPVQGFSSTNTDQITLPSLKAGNYTFGLKVTSNSGLTDTADVIVVVNQERDDPPQAVAGRCSEQKGDFTVSLPQESVFICGNHSHDDKKIVSWTWTKVDEDGLDILPADLAGTSGPVLTVSKIKPGTYTFELKVTDEKNQADQKTIRMHVNPAANKAPVAKVGANQTVVLPKSDVILDGSQSTDDHEVTKFSWTRIRGPGDVKWANQDQAQATASDLMEGLYHFRLNVSDQQGLWSSVETFVFVNRSKNTAPIALAEDVTMDLPSNFAVLDGSMSHDDAGIIRWKWELMENSSSALTMLGNTSQESALNLTNLMEGKYTFNFTVFDHAGLKNSKNVHLSLRRSEKRNESVEMYLKKRMPDFTGGVKKRLGLKLGTLLSSEVQESTDLVDVRFTDVGVDHSTGRVRVVFYCSYDDKNGKGVLVGGSQAVELIKRNMEILTEFQIHKVDTLYCRNPCSGHGVCDDYTKECSCESYWMPNLFTYYVLGRGGNCMLLASTIAGTLWAMVCAGKRVCPCPRLGGAAAKPLRRRKYRMLNEKHKGRMEFKKSNGKNGVQLSSLLVSDSNFSDSDEEETVYDKSSTSVKRSSSSSALLNGGQKIKA